MIVLIGGEKGGTGKSTIATNLAVCLARNGRDVVLLDADRQSTSANWASERERNNILTSVNCVQRYGNIAGSVRDFKKRYQDIVIDAGGRDSEEMRSAMVVADALYSPLKASQSDLWTVGHLNSLIALARGFNEKLVAVAVLSMAPTNPRITEVGEAREMLAEFTELRLAAAVIRDRKAYRDAMCDGRGVVEADDPKATEEMKRLVEEIYDGQVQSIAAVG